MTRGKIKASWICRSKIYETAANTGKGTEAETRWGAAAARMTRKRAWEIGSLE